MAEASPVTRLLQRLGRGDDGAAGPLLELIYEELHALARARMQGRDGVTLQPTVLVHEAWMRLVDVPERRWRSRAQFFKLAARAMRSILIDHARRRRSVKRGEGRPHVPLDEVVLGLEESTFDLVALDDELDRLAEIDGDAALIVELRFFGGLEHKEITEATGIPLRTVERQWSMARTWLYERLAPRE